MLTSTAPSQLESKNTKINAWIKTEESNLEYPIWKWTCDKKEILEAAPGDIIFGKNYDDMIVCINQRLGAPEGLSLAKKYGHNQFIEQGKPFLPIHHMFLGWSENRDEKIAEKITKYARIYGRVETDCNNFYSNLKMELWKRGCITRNNNNYDINTVVIYQPKTAEKYLKKRLKAIKREARRRKIRCQKMIFKEDIERFVYEMKYKGHENIQFREYRTKYALSEAVIPLADIWNWRYGKGSYRGLPAFKRLRKKWISRPPSTDKELPVLFIKWMNREINEKSMPNTIVLKSRNSLFYELLETQRYTHKNSPKIDISDYEP